MTSIRAKLSSVVAAVVAVTGTVIAGPTGALAVENPILGDGSSYSADPAPLVVGDKLYVFAGRDEAGVTQNDFIMNEWQAFSTTDVAADFDTPAWEHHAALMRPEQVFAWATPGRAYAGQVVKGADGRYYWYVPVHEAVSTAPDKFGIGVAVSDNPLGPFTDHAGGPIVSQTLLNNTIHNIDPTVLVDDDGSVYMWWGSFGNLRMTALEPDMKTRKDTVQTVTGLTGFFEAPWTFKRNGTYYLAYAGNNAGPTSACTPANYHACIAYATASAPTGPWTYRGTILPPVSSTTSHPGIVEFKGQWYIAYHTADAEGGNHFRRSVAIDKVEWDDTQTPPRMKPVQITPPHVPDRAPRPNIAHEATVTVSNSPVPTQYWVKALNDEIIRPNPLPPDMWGTWTGNRPAQQWAQYTWAQPVRVSGSQIQFWRDQPPGIGTGVSNPASWVIQYRDTTGAWVDVPNPGEYPTAHDQLLSVTFDPVTTTQLRATFNGSPSTTTPTMYAAIAVQEWTVLAAQPDSIAPVTATTWRGAPDGPQLPRTVSATYPGNVVLDVPVYWDAIDPATLQTTGTVPVRGSALGYAGGYVEATITVLADAPWRDNVGQGAVASASYTAPQNRVTALNDDIIPADGRDPALLWGTAPQVGEQWVEYTWTVPKRVNRSEIAFFQDVANGEPAGVQVPASWRIQYWNATISGWVDVASPIAYGTEPTGINVTTFDPVTTTRLRAVLQSQGTVEGGGSLAVREWRVISEEPDVTSPTMALSPSGVEGSGGWFTSAVTVPVIPSDDRDTRFTITTKVGDAAPVVHTNVREASVAVAADGEHAVTVTVSDQSGNSRELSLALKIDRTAPTVSGTVDAAARSVTVAAADESSGLASVEYGVDTQSSWQPYTAPVVVDLFKHDVSFRATDNAGNRSARGIVTVPISPDAPMVGNIAPFATPTASYTAPWNNVNAVNDGQGVNTGGAQGSLWGTWTGDEPVTRWLQYNWDREVSVESSETMFWRDAVAGSGAGVAVPQSWYIEFWDKTTEAWVNVANPSAYGTADTGTNTTTFDKVTTTRLRATFTTNPNATGTSRSAVAVSEWKVFAADTVAPTVAFATDPATPASGWFASAVSVSATAEDDVDDAPSIEVRLGAGAWTAYTAAVPISGDGQHAIVARATDDAGNVSTEVTLVVKLDSTAPQAAAEMSTRSRAVVLTATDAGSGVARIEAHLGDGEWVTTEGVLALPDAAVTVHFRAVDVAGNVEAARTLAAAAVPVFADVAAGDANYAGIRWMARAGLADGEPAGNRLLFHPTRTTLRAELAAFLHRYAGDGFVPAVGTQTFSDVGPGHAAYAAVEWMAAEGLTAGIASGVFDLDKAVARRDVALILYRLAGSPDVDRVRRFNDVAAGSELAAAATWAAQTGIIPPRSRDKFGVSTVMKRGDLASILYRYDAHRAD